MGFFSYLCKECGHPLLCAQAADKGINDWMTQAVALTPRGGRVIGAYDGYGSVGGCEDLGCEDLDNTACLHEACWEVAGKPEWSHYGSVSHFAPDQGWFFDDGAHDLIDPRIKEDREDLLRKGIAARTKARFDARAREVHDWLHDDEPLDPERAPFEHRFSYGKCYKDGKRLAGKFYLTDKWSLVNLPENFDGTEDEVRSVLAKHWDEFVESDYCKKLLARATELHVESKRKYLEDLKVNGRYEVSYGPSLAKGDIVEGHKCSRDLFRITDKMTYKDVVVFDYEGTPREFPERSSEWDARVEENRADARARHAKADAEATRLNAEWAGKGYPAEFPEG